MDNSHLNKKKRARSMIMSESTEARGNDRRPFSSQLQATKHKKNNEAPSKRHAKIIHTWKNLSPDILRLIITRLNYEERIRFRAVCKGWNFIKNSINDFIHDIPLNAVVAILMTLAINRFEDFFNFYIYWIKGQTNATIKILLDQVPIQKLYLWGNKAYRPQESMFTYFMNMSQRLGNNDAEFYWASKSIILRNHINYDIVDYSYTVIKQISEKGHMTSILFKNMLDIYFFPEKRKDAVTSLINIITTPGTEKTITGSIMAIRSIANEIYPEAIFGPLTGTPICNYSLPIEDDHYQPDGYPVIPDQIYEYACRECKVAVLFGCLSAYLTSDLDFHLSY